MSTAAVRGLAFATILMCAALALGAETATSSSDTHMATVVAQDVFAARSDLLAAVLVALQSYERDLNPGSATLQPIDLLKRDLVVSCARAAQGKVKVSVRPSSTRIRGGGVTYVLDATNLAIIEELHEQ